MQRPPHDMTAGGEYHKFDSRQHGSEVATCVKPPTYLRNRKRDIADCEELRPADREASICAGSLAIGMMPYDISGIPQCKPAISSPLGDGITQVTYMRNGKRVTATFKNACAISIRQEKS